MIGETTLTKEISGMRMSWEEIVAQYPDKWVALTSVEFKDNQITSGVVEGSCNDEGMSKLNEELIHKGVDIFWAKTTWKMKEEPYYEFD